MSNFSAQETSLEGVKILRCPYTSDLRGSFVKTYHAEIFSNLGISFSPAESFITTSGLGVIRGMHYQSDIHAHDKLVYCLAGKILDVIVDIRSSKSQFNRPISITLDSKHNCAVFIPKGYAHGFLSQCENSVLLYQTSKVHSPKNDKGPEN